MSLLVGFMSAALCSLLTHAHVPCRRISTAGGKLTHKKSMRT